MFMYKVLNIELNLISVELFKKKINIETITPQKAKHIFYIQHF